MVSLESCNGLSRHWSKNTIDRSGIITVPLQLGLDFNHDLVGRQIAVTIDRTIVRIISVRSVTPCRIPVSSIPEVPASADKDDSVVVAAPPIPVMPLSVIISKRSILLPTEPAAPPIIRDRDISVSVNANIGGVVAREISVTKIPITIHRDVILHTSLIVESRIAISNLSLRCNTRTNGRVSVSLANPRTGRSAGTKRLVAIELRRGPIGMCFYRQRGNATLRPDGRRSGHLLCPRWRDLGLRVPARASMHRCCGRVVVIVLFCLGHRRQCQRCTRAY